MALGTKAGTSSEPGDENLRALLEVKGLITGYGKKKVLHGVDLMVYPGETFLLIGPNGAGKTTALNTILGVHPIWKGNVFFEGRKITGNMAYSTVRQGIRLVPQGQGVFSQLRVEDNLRFGLELLPNSKDYASSLSEVYDLFPILDNRRKQIAGSLSGGQRQMLSIGMALASRPKMLFLDEPSLGLAPALVDKVIEALTRLINSGLTILLVEQNVGKAIKVANRVGIMRSGVIVHNQDSGSINVNELWQYF